MSHNERGLRVSAYNDTPVQRQGPVKRHDVTVEVLVRVDGQGNKNEAKARAEHVVNQALRAHIPLADYAAEVWNRPWHRVKMLGRPNAKRAQMAPEEGE